MCGSGEFSIHNQERLGSPVRVRGCHTARFAESVPLLRVLLLQRFSPLPADDFAASRNPPSYDMRTTLMGISSGVLRNCAERSTEPLSIAHFAAIIGIWTCAQVHGCSPRLSSR